MPSFANEILFGTLEGVDHAIQRGADIEEIDEYGFSPLIEAAIANKVDVAALLLEYGAEINKTDATGRTALHWAVDNHNLELCQLLLANKADPNAYTTAGQPILVYPLLRQQQRLKKLLYQYGAKLNFAQDFIQAKLLGHRYELSGHVDIVNGDGHFIEIDYEGFFLEFTVDVITHSLQRYKNNFSARHLRPFFKNLRKIIQAFSVAQALLKYQRYTIDIKQHRHSIDALLDQELLLLPIAYEGHAIALVKYKDWLIRCDRGENSWREGSIVIYQLQNRQAWNLDLCQQLIFNRQSREFLTETIHRLLALKPIANLPIGAQIIGNCSWANIEASIPAMLFILQLDVAQKSDTLQIDSQQWDFQRDAAKVSNRSVYGIHKDCELSGNTAENASAKSRHRSYALDFYHAWHQWDKERALEECIQGFYEGSKARQVSKATLLAAILFQHATQFYNDLSVAETILAILNLPDHCYLLKGYLEVYWKLSKTSAGKAFLALLDSCGINVRAHISP